MKSIIICGPTGTGKTDLAIQLAKKLCSVIISADSRQLYKHLPISTNQGEIKNLRKYNKSDLSTISEAFSRYQFGQIEEVDCHLTSFLEPNQTFNTYDFQQSSYRLIQDYNQQNIIPIIVGGTGLYIDSLVRKYQLKTGKPDQYLRTYLASKSTIELKNLVHPEVFSELNSSDQSNRQRLMRIIEKQKLIKEDFLKDEFKKEKPSQINYSEFIFLYPKFEWEDLKSKIRSRVDQMVKNDMFGEIKRLLDTGCSKNSPAITSSGVKDIIRYFEGEISFNEAIELIKIKHIQYAKRQKTWFEGQGRAYVLHKVGNIEDCEKVLRQFLNSH